MKHIGKSLPRLLALASSLPLLSLSAANPDAAIEAAKPSELELQVYFDDLAGAPFPTIGNVREDLLQNALSDAADRNEWIGDYDFEYNATPDADGRSYLAFTVLDWERSRTNFYRFSAKAEYVDPDGSIHPLGIFAGYESGISVTTKYDVGARFSEVAEKAINEALAALKDTIAMSS